MMQQEDTENQACKICEKLDRVIALLEELAKPPVLTPSEMTAEEIEKFKAAIQANPGRLRSTPVNTSPTVDISALIQDMTALINEHRNCSL